MHEPAAPGDITDETFVAPLTSLERLHEFTTALVGAETTEQVADVVMTAGLAATGAIAGSLMVISGSSATLIDHRSIDDTILDRWQRFNLEPGADPISDAVSEREAVLIPDVQAFLARYPDLAFTVEGRGHEAWAVVPLMRGATVVGALGLIFDEPKVFDTFRRLSLLTIANLTAQATLRALVNAEQTASLDSLRRSLLDVEAPTLQGASIGGFYLPAANTSVTGGDWFDAIEIDEDHLLFVVGDVASHGPSAVGEMGRARALVQAYAIERHDPPAIAAWTSKALNRLGSSFATAVIAVLDRSVGVLTWTTAGHPYPALQTGGMAAELLAETHGSPLGVDDVGEYGSSSRRVEPGDRLFLYTDGLVERRDHPFDDDLEWLISVIGTERMTPQQDVVRIANELNAGRPHDDDIALLVIEID